MEVKRQYGLNLRQFDIFDPSEYSTISECRIALKEMYYSGLYEENPPSKVYYFQNTKTGEKVELSEDDIESRAKKLLGIAPSSVWRLINKSNLVISNWQ